METKNQGVLLHAIPYLGHGRILKVFTKDGLITLIGKSKKFATLSPFCIGEWVYKKQKSELFSLTEYSMEHPLLDLRASYTTLTSAISIAEALLSSQLPLKPAPHLYLLLCSYLKNLPRFRTPEILSLSFRMKLLLHEGLIDLRLKCKFCEELGACLQDGETVCQLHKEKRAIDFSLDEWQIVQIMTLTKNFADLINMDWPPNLKPKIDALFQEHIKY
ncbi:MAG: DNA repair protein RecO [Chlamydiae bacterium]|nr:DNA repair protein RecO [Chlamydiota bacterium]